MLRKDDILLTQPALWSKLKVYGKTIKYVQLLTPNLSSNVSVFPSANQVGSYITILDPSLVGHKVYVKITADTEEIGLCFFKEYGLGLMAYNLLNGEELYPNTEPTGATEGVFTITQDMVHSGTNYLQLYYFVYKNCTVGTHTITVQLVDLTELGMDNIINPVLFNATDLGKYMQNNTLNRGSGLISVESPLKASEGTYNQLVEDLTSPYTDRGLTCSFNNQTKHYVINGTSTTTYARTLKDINVLTSHKYFMRMSIVRNDSNLSFGFQLLNAGLHTPNISNGSAEVIGNPNQDVKTNVGITDFSVGTIFNNVEVMFSIIDLTQLGLDSITTIDQFYATNVGKLVKKYGYLPYSATNTQFGRTLNLIKEGNHIKLNGIGDLKDTYTNYNGKYTQVVDEDLEPLPTPIVETLSSKMIPSGITEIIDKNGVSVEYKKL